MRTTRVWLLLGAILCALSISSVYAAGYTIGVPILGTTGAPALSGTEFTGILTAVYADGTPVVLGSEKVVLELCAVNCVTQPVILKQTAPGTYAYSFIPPSSLTGTITILVGAGSLADDNGRIFPDVDTQIGTYATPSLSSSSPSTAGDRTALPANPVRQSDLEREALALQEPKESSPVVIVLTVVMVLTVAGVLLIFPRKR